MKKLRFKKPFNGLTETLQLIPKKYMVEGQTFIMSDGKQSLTVRWGDGKPTILTSEGNDVKTETLDRLKSLMNFNPRETHGNLIGESRIKENDVFSDMINKDTFSLANGVEPEGDDFKSHGTYTVSNTGGYEVELADSGDGARLKLPNGEITDWFEIEFIPNDEDGELEPVIDPNGYNVPLNMVMRNNIGEGFNGVDQQTGLTEDGIDDISTQPGLGDQMGVENHFDNAPEQVDLPVPESNDAIINNAIQILKDATATSENPEAVEELNMALNNFQGKMNSDTTNEFGDDMMGAPTEDGVPVYSDEERDLDSYGMSDSFDVDNEEEISIDDMGGDSFDIDNEEEIPMESKEPIDEDRSGKFIQDAVKFFEDIYNDKYTDDYVKEKFNDVMRSYNVNNFKDLEMRISSKTIDELLTFLNSVFKTQEV